MTFLRGYCVWPQAKAMPSIEGDFGAIGRRFTNVGKLLFAATFQGSARVGRRHRMRSRYVRSAARRTVFQLSLSLCGASPTAAQRLEQTHRSLEAIEANLR